MATISEALTLALQHHQAGRLPEAEQIYRQVLAIEPNHADALHLLGVLAHQVGRNDLAIEFIQQAIALSGNAWLFYFNLANIHMEQRRPAQAVALYRRAVELSPDNASAHNNLGNAVRELGALDQAIVSYQRALELKPDFYEAHNNLGAVWQAQGKMDEAIDCYRRALELKPDYISPHFNLGVSFQAQRKLEEAVASYRRTLELKPDYIQAHFNLAVTFHALWKLDEAAACFRRALELQPDLAEGHSNFGNLLLDQEKPDEAIACYRQALLLRPDFGEAHYHLGNALRTQGKMREAVASYRRALQLKPDSVDAHCNLLLSLPYGSETLPGELSVAYAEFNQRCGIPLAPRELSYSNDRSAGRRLRIGYISPDFREHVVGRGILPLFREHDHQQFEVFCYAQVLHQDEFTDRFQACADTWRSVVGLSDEALAQRVREDRIDILVDLVMHTADHRLLVMARRPAPVQVTFAGLLGTTGLTAIDYRLTDPYLDPPGLHDQRYSEASFRLPDTFWCYAPLGDQPAVNPLPAGERGYVTFGCLNNFCKVNDSVLSLWAQVLRAVEGSRLLLLAPEGTIRGETLRRLGQEGVEPVRVMFESRQPHRQYLELYHQIDLGLDTFPYNGHATSLDSYWMGVPVITLVGMTIVGRAGLSQLTNLKLTELIAQTPDEFVKIAVELAQDLPRLSELRSSLRERMQRSPLMDPVRFTRGIEAAYRAMWRRWCGE